MVQTRKRRTRKADVSSQYYVGYVEDDESIDAIMKKFEELERIEKEFANKASTSKPAEADNTKPGESSPCDKADGAGEDAEDPENPIAVESTENNDQNANELTTQQLEEIFKRTSAFTVRSAMLHEAEIEALDDVELWKAEYDVNNSSEFDEADDYIHFDDDFWDEEFGVSHTRPRRGPRKERGVSGPKLSAKEQILQRYRYMQVRIQDRHGHTFFVNRKVNAVDPSMPTYVRIPPAPIPRSWVKNIINSEMLKPTKETEWSLYNEVLGVLDIDFTQFGTNHHCVYMDPPLKVEGISSHLEHYFDIKKLSVIPIHKMLVPGAFLFTWCEKELLPEMCIMAEKQWGLKYVENFCWIKQHPNNQMAKEPSRYFRRTKMTLLIFRKEGDLEMRHQRSPDCVFDFIKPTQPYDLTSQKPEFMYQVIETLLPLALCTSELSKPDRLLHLWAPKDKVRKSWTTIHQKVDV